MSSFKKHIATSNGITDISSQNQIFPKTLSSSLLKMAKY